MTKEEFSELFFRCASEVADEFYPKDKNPRRGEFLRGSGAVCGMLADLLTENGVIVDD